MYIRKLSILCLFLLFSYGTNILGQENFFMKKSDSMELVYNLEGKSDVKVALPLQGAVDVLIDWGDGSGIEAVTEAGDVEHIFSGLSLDTIRITGSLEQFGKGSYSASGVEYLKEVLSFGNLGIKSFFGAFSSAKNLLNVPNSLPEGVTDLSYMFSGASSFNSDLSSWNVSNVVNMTGVFYKANSFNGDLSSWDVCNVENMSHIFSGAESFNGDLSSWDVSKVTDMTGMFYEASSFNGDLSSWDVSKVNNMRNMFYEAISFNSDLSSWDVSSVIYMPGMFYGAKSFANDLSSWDVSSVKKMRYMFYYAKSLTCDLDTWDVSNVADMGFMFAGAESFNGNISSWDVSNVVDMRSMFSGATSFTGDLSSWDVGKVTDMTAMFRQAYLFNCNLSSWNVSSVSSMISMFEEATSFNGDVSSWDVSAVTTMSLMLSGAESFAGDLSSWDVSSVEDMKKLFFGAKSFNSNISSWDVSNVKNMISMFSGARSFDCDLSSWNISNVYQMIEIFAGSFLSTKNYDKLLYSWSKLPSLQPGVYFGAQDTKCSAFGKKYRDILETKYSWHIDDDGIITEEQPPLIVNINPLNKDSIGLKIDASLPIKITAFDPELKPLSYQWKLNGSLLDTTSDSLLFKQTSAGIYQLKVLVIDDKNLKDSVSWKIRVSSSGESITDNLVTESTLFQNYPNPFNPVTNIKFYLTSGGPVSLKIYNYRGEVVKELTNNMLNKGFHSFNFDGSLFSSGVYFYRLSGQGFTHQKKMILLK